VCAGADHIAGSGWALPFIVRLEHKKQPLKSSRASMGKNVTPCGIGSALFGGARLTMTTVGYGDLAPA